MITKEINIGKPPADGMGFVFILLAFGLSTAPMALETNVIKGVKISEIQNVITKTIKNLSEKGIADIVIN